MFDHEYAEIIKIDLSFKREWNANWDSSDLAAG